jgi:hypothetical protein
VLSQIKNEKSLERNREEIPLERAVAACSLEEGWM